MKRKGRIIPALAGVAVATVLLFPTPALAQTSGERPRVPDIHPGLRQVIHAAQQ